MPRYKALLIGNGTFEQDSHNLPELKGPRNDLALLKEALSHPQVGIHAGKDIATLLDGTSQEIREAVGEFFLAADPDDQLLFYYSGHGFLDNFNGLYFCARDTRVDRLPKTAIPSHLVSECIRGSEAKSFAVILDCCFSGQFKGGQIANSIAEGTGRFLLTSCQSAALSADGGQPNSASAFTQILIEALLSGEVDQNGNGYVELNEVYNYILPRLKAKTGQIPQRHLDKTTGDIPLGKAFRSDDPAAISGTATAIRNRPILNVSTLEINLKDVSPDEILPEEFVDVLNDGGGELNWKVEATAPWIELEQQKGFFKVRLRPPQAGTINRANIRVFDQGRGGSKTIRVIAHVLAETPKPNLAVSPKRLEFGTVTVGSALAPQTLRIINCGGGKLEAQVRAVGKGIQARQLGDIVEVSLETVSARKFEGEIQITSNGGSTSIPVLGIIEAGPVLQVGSKRVSFGKVPARTSRTLTVAVTNAGSGKMEWSHASDETFFRCRREGNGLSVTVENLSVGHFLGSIRIKSDGGEATINVDAEGLAEAPKPPPLPPIVPAINLAGLWRGQTGSLFLNGQGNFYQYVEHNLFGIQVGNGTMALNGNAIHLEGQSMYMPLSGQLLLHGNQMAGTVWSVNGPIPVFFARG